jgi:hypothetical protein
MSQQLKERISDILNNDIFNVPPKAIVYQYFPEFIREKLSDYLAVIKDSNFWAEFLKIHHSSSDKRGLEDKYIRMIETLCNCINESIDSYYMGKVNEAYKQLSGGLTTDGILFASSKLFQDAIHEIPVGDLISYRIRIKEDLEFTKENMFHIPFEKRGKVGTQRYSIPGHPSLYLGDSIFVCWEELNRPQIRDVYACKFRNAQAIKLIEINRASDILRRVSDSELTGTGLSSEIFRFLLTYPLAITSSVKTKDRKDAFKPEYIIPQLFLQFVMEHKKEIDGIKYYSTRVDYERVKNVGTYNYVFPTREIQELGYCKNLIKKFNFSEPLLWENEKISTEHRSGTFLGGGGTNDKSIELTKGRKSPYSWSAFGAIEGVLGYETVKLSQLNQ